MKRNALLFLMLLMLGASGVMKAQETLTVYEGGTETRDNVPMFVNYFHHYTKAQTVFPASDLTAMVGRTITAITFYTTSDNIPYTTRSSAVIYLKEVQDATISAYIDKSTATIVCTGFFDFVSDGNEGGMVTITFTTPYQYNGGNLLFGCENTDAVVGNNKQMKFKGIYAENACISGQSTSTPITGQNQRNFLPKTTFTYTYTYSQPVNLQVSSVTDQSATLTWQAPETTSTIVGYSYNYKEHSASEWSSDYQTNSTQATLNNLDSFTEYDFRVKALYSGNHESSYVTTTFRTECATITVTAETPWTENFENFYHSSTTFASDVWSNNGAYYVNEGCWGVDGLYSFPALYLDTPVAFSGRGNLQFMNRGDIQILILPEFTNALNTLQFEFKGNYYNHEGVDNQGTLEIGYYDGNGFHAVCTSDKITTPRGSSGHNATGDYMGPYPLSGDIPSGSRMALRYTPKDPTIHTNTGVATGCINLDDFRVSITPSCPSPQNLEESNVTSNSATFGWVEKGEADAWQICLNGDETNLITASNNPFTVEGLTASTAYTAKVRAYCDEDDQSDWSNEVSFTTECEPYTITAEAPYTQDFETPVVTTTYNQVGKMPVCWENYPATKASAKILAANVPYNYAESSQVLYFYGDGNNYAVLPEFTNPLNTLQISFKYATESQNYGTLTLGYITDEDENYSSFTAIAGGTFNASYESDQTFVDVNPIDLSALPTNATHLVFCWYYSSQWGCNVDDVEVSLRPISLTKTIAAYTNSQAEKGGYYLIASPLAAAIDPATVGMITDELGAEVTPETSTYDLYSFNQAEADEWRNFRTSNFNLVNGTGYLYASKNGTTLTFSGAPGTNGQVNLVYDSNAEEFAGWNLVGNPFAQDAYITKSFYTLENSDTYTSNTAGTAIHAMQGLLVVADEDGEPLTFTPAEAPAGNNSKLNMNVSKVGTHGVSTGSTTANVVDQAIISFTEGQQLPKLQFRNGSTKVYLPKDGKEYAIVSTEAMGTMPVNFKAENDGTYTLSFTAEEVSFSYLHLIDNMTGEDVDLLAGASTGSATYTFEAKTTDYESRFKLVFATGNNANDDAFAFFSNGSFVINNPSTSSGTSEATLQVIDVNGRILKSESINGCANVDVKAAAGVYMLRLVNGNDVKVQKVVVR